MGQFDGVVGRAVVTVRVGGSWAARVVVRVLVIVVVRVEMREVVEVLVRDVGQGGRGWGPA